MIRTTTLLLLLAAMLLAGCGPASDATAPAAGQPGDAAYPGPALAVYPTITPYYPAPAAASGANAGVKPIYNYKPTTSDDNLARGEVFIDLKASQVAVMESSPVQINVLLKGDLPDPCHALRVVPVTDEANQRVDLEVYSLTPKSGACVAVLQPFEATIALGSFTGSFTVYANGEQLGEFDS